MPVNLDLSNNIALAFFQMAREHPRMPVYWQAHRVHSEHNQILRSWRASTYQESAARIKSIAAYLRSIGLRKGDRVSIISATRAEWLEADLAVLSCGAVVASIYQSLLDHDVGYILFDSGSKIVFAENQEQVDKLLRLLSATCNIPACEDRPEQTVKISLTKIISFEEVAAHELIISLSDIINKPSDFSLDQLNEISRTDLASLVYTSGTTGPAKGVMQTHGNHLSNVRQARQADIYREDSSLILFLPLAHSFARLVGYIGFLTTAQVKFPAVMDPKSSKQNPAALAIDVQSANVQIVLVVPRMLEKMMEAIQRTAEHHGLRSGLLRLTLWAARVNYSAKKLKQVKSLVALMHALCAFVRKGIKKKLFGKNFMYAVSGGAKLSIEVTEFFDSLGIEVFEGYGLTETCVATNVNRSGRKKIGTVGQILAPDIEMKIAEDGEILFRGPNISLGYYNRPTATKAAWDSQGYFHTGDLGSVDQDGYLKIEGRKKELIITSGGKNISPENVEHSIKTSKYISQAVLIGDGRPYCVAIITLAHDIVIEWAKKQGITLGSDWITDAAVHTLIDGEISKVNNTLASFESIKRFLIVPEFTIDNRLLTPTLKVKRKEVLNKYASEVDKLYRRHEHS